MFLPEDLEIVIRDLAQFSQSQTCLGVADRWFPQFRQTQPPSASTSRTAHLLVFARKNSATD
jgi:hypothetical protein